MALKRIIPCLLYDGSGLVKTVKFKHPSYIGDPINAIKIFNDKEVDELILIDINASKQKRKPNFHKIADMASEAFMPFAYGGGVKTYEDFATLYKIGVEKVIVNSLIQEDREIIKKVTSDYGAQAVVACVDIKKRLFGQKSPYSHIGHKIKAAIVEYAKFLENEVGVGELMVQSVDNDGTWEGYDDEVTEQIVKSVNIPVIASGGCGNVDHLKKILYTTNAHAAAIGSMAVYSKKGMGVLIHFPKREEVIVE
ncbi:MAG: imidazole glycerol phosphate synthase subunit HisF [Sphingobacteriaceae bacterium]|nr:imidazole glycerol phosphate synthase subunit HisF [Sphingobacteriaceae bacterium]